MNTSAINTYRRQVYANVYTKRTNGLFNLTDSLLTTTERIINPAWLSLQTSNSYGAIYQSLTNGTINQTQLLQATLTATATAGFPNIFVIDTTNIVKPRARTSPERVLLHQSGHTKYSHQTAAGWKAQYLTQVTGQVTSWVVPLHTRILTPFENVNIAAFNQIQLLCEHVSLKQNERITILLDAGYHAPTLTAWVRQHNLPVTLIVRLANNLVFYTNPNRDITRTGQGPVLNTFRDTIRKRGRETIHGQKLVIKTANLPVDVSISGRVENYGDVTVKVWKHMHAKLTGVKLAAAGSKPVEGNVITVQATSFTRNKTKGTLHLWSSDTLTLNLPLFTILFTYLQRYSIEHLFRFLKHSFGMLNYHAKDKQSFLNWLNIQMVAYTQLVLAKTITRPVRLPWDTRTRLSVTPYKTWNSFKQLLLSLWYPTVNTKNYKPGPGKPSGGKQKKRKRYRIVRKWHPEVQNLPITPT